MRVPRGRIRLIILVVVVLGACLGLWLFIRKGSGASYYGVTDPTKAALVVVNRTEDFYITGVRLTRDDGQSLNLEEATVGEKALPINPGLRGDEGRRRVFAIEPGHYTIEIRYSDRSGQEHPAEGAGLSVDWYVDRTETAEFTVRRGRNVVLGLQFGDAQGGMFYTPPQLFGP